MARFAPRKPLQTSQAAITVDPGLPPGIYRFALVVTDENGLDSKADYRTVEVIAEPTYPDSAGKPLAQQ